MLTDHFCSSAPAVRASFVSALLSLTALLSTTNSVAAQGLGPNPVNVKILSQKTKVEPGSQFAIAIVMKHEEGWKTWPGYKQKVEGEDALHPAIDEFAIRTVIAAGAPGTLKVDALGHTTLKAGTTPIQLKRLGPIQWADVSTIEVANPVPDIFPGDTTQVNGFKKEAIHYIPIVIDPAAEIGSFGLEVQVYFQACDKFMCVAPAVITETFEFEILKEAPLVALSPEEQEIFRGFDSSVFAADYVEETEKLEITVFGWRFVVDPSGLSGFLLMMLISMLGGFILNLTPCVLPVIPLKIMGLSNSAGSRARTLYLGVVMSVGVVAFFLAIGWAIATLSSFNQISSLFQQPAFSIGVGLVIAILAVGMIGAFSTGLPQWVYKITPKHDSTSGSFLWGVMTAVLSTPCTAPFMGSASAWATQQAPPVTMTAFSAIGLGMALPYLVLAANPNWVKFVPRAGESSVLVKQVIGLVLLAVACFFAGSGIASLLVDPPEPPSKLHWYPDAFLTLAAALWLVFRTVKIAQRPSTKIGWTAAALLFAVPVMVAALSQVKEGPINWVFYTPNKLEEAIGRGDVIVIDFTAEWCLNCKALESGVLYREKVATVLNGDGVTPIKVDLTGNNEAGSQLLESYKWQGIPLLVINGPGLKKAILLGEGYTPTQVLEAIESARGASSKKTAKS